MELYFLDDGSLIIDTPKSIQLIEEVAIVRNIGSHYLGGLSGKETYDILVNKYDMSAKNGLSSSEEPIRAKDREDK